jgi:hypothetical protein
MGHICGIFKHILSLSSDAWQWLVSSSRYSIFVSRLAIFVAINPAQVQRQMVRCAVNPGEMLRIRAIACIEPSQLLDGGESGGDNAIAR